MANEPLDLPQPPPELAAILQDPRVADMKEAPSYAPRARCVLAPTNPPARGDSPFLLFREYDPDENFGDVDWLNEPAGMSFVLRTGDGQGFKLVTETPRFRERKKKPARRVQVWHYSSWLIASPEFASILQSFDPGVLATVPIDYEFADGARIDGYVFLDITRRIHAYDYARSEVWVEMEQGKKFVAGLGHPRALRPDIDPAFHVFRDAYFRSHIFMSRPLARALSAAGIRGFRFEDPVSIDTVEFE
jgi:hypothetical protein